MKSQKEFHLASLDGMRALAVMLVFVSHAGWGHIFPGGFGVTMFFFLSGYLITTLLRMEYEKDGTISFRSFYLRRIYRILPPMYLVLFLILLLAKLDVIEDHVTLAGVMAQIAQVTNYYILQAQDAGIVPYTGTFWSLAVEEHFYLVFPVLFLFGVSRWRYSTVAKLFLAICVLELAWRCVLVFGFDAPPNRTYMATDTRLDNLLFGCIMGIWMNPALDRRQPFPESRIVKACILAASLALLLLTFFVRNDAFRETARYTVQGLALFPIFWLAVKHSDWPVFRILNLEPMRLMGAISYVFYLSHFFWLHVSSVLIKDNKFLSALLGFAMTVLFSWLVYRLVERPFSRLRRRLHEPRKQIKPSDDDKFFEAAVELHPTSDFKAQ